MRIGTKLSLGFSVMLAMVVGLGGLLLGMQRYAVRGFRRIETAHARSEAIAQVKNALHNQRQALWFPVPIDHEDPLASLQNHHHHVRRALSQWEEGVRQEGDDFRQALYPTEPNHLEPIELVMSSYNRLWDQWQADIKAQGGVDPSSMSLNPDDLASGEELEQLIDQAQRAAMIHSERIGATLKRGLVRRLQEVTLLVGATVIIMFVVWKVVTQTMTQSLRRLRTALDTLAQAQQPGWILRDTGDDIDDVAFAFEKVAGDFRMALKSVARLRHEVKVRQKAQHRLSLLRQKLRSLASELSLAEERERRRVAGGLHDHICQKLVLSKLNLQFLQRRLDDEKLTQVLDQQCQLLDEMINEARTLTFELGNPLLHEVGLDAALDSWLRRNVPKRLGLRCELVSTCAGLKLAEHVRVYLYRAVCELVTNTVKHARARSVIIRLSHQDGQIVITVHDDGIGFDVASVLSEHRDDTGFGLFSVFERVQYLGGTLSVNSQPGQGTRVTLCIPESLVADSKERPLSKPTS